MIVVALVPFLLGVLIGWGGYLGWRERLPTDRSAGVRTSATLRSEEAFRLANKVAGLPTLAGGAVGVLGGVAAFFVPNTVGTVVVAAIGLLGMFGLLVGGGVLGHRAALAVPAPAAPTGGCAGCACGTGGCAPVQPAGTA
ncbi:SdpI family protein [Amycolatopsis cihanbeyliensis]|uniref:SdpI/YhfL family protein n=1 Tax=Amycolatopsis cihanbeyliensis TaxID=1128664 RepID=A0A542DLD1_AMYCI|nr:SdpI family protein [Amycolatopsis cihanbeyliensis]TQJ03834.1 SdpI/YhfL family protein [Amycolatopsis cihanbeyliensis]